MEEKERLKWQLKKDIKAGVAKGALGVGLVTAGFGVAELANTAPEMLERVGTSVGIMGGVLAGAATVLSVAPNLVALGMADHVEKKRKLDMMTKLKNGGTIYGVHQNEIAKMNEEIRDAMFHKYVCDPTALDFIEKE